MMRNFPPQKLAISVPYLWLLNDALILESLKKKRGMETVLLKPFFVIYFIFLLR